MRMILHVGAVKAASSSLQFGLFENLPGIRNMSMQTRNFVYYLAREKSHLYSPARARELLPPMDGDAALISAEQLGFFDRIDRSVTAGRLADIFPDAKIMIVSRNQLTILPSLYMHLVMTGKITGPFRDWLKYQWSYRDNSFLEQMDYWSAVSLYRSIWGSENVGVFTFELLGRDPSEFTRQVCAFIGVERVSGEYAEKTHLMPAGDRWDHLQRKSPVLGRSWQAAKPLVPKGVRRSLRSIAPALSRPAKAKIDEEWRARLTEYYAPGNRLLSELVDIAGYPL